MKRHTLILTLDLPQGSNARALAESLTTDFNVASITGSDGEFEVRLVSPAELVVVISASHAQFFRTPIVDNDHDDDDDDDDPDDVAEEISIHLARRVGTLRHEDDEDDEDENSNATDDDSDLVAQRVIERLLNEGLLELVTPRSRPGIEEFLAHRLAHKRVSETLCDDLADAKGVAELYTSDEQLYEIIAACRSKRAAPAAVVRDPKPRLATSAKTTAKMVSNASVKSVKSVKSESKVALVDKPKPIKPRKAKK